MQKRYALGLADAQTSTEGLVKMQRQSSGSGVSQIPASLTSPSVMLTLLVRANHALRNKPPGDPFQQFPAMGFVDLPAKQNFQPDSPATLNYFF